VSIQMPPLLQYLVSAVNRGDSKAAVKAFRQDAVVEVKAQRAVYTAASIRTLVELALYGTGVCVESTSYNRVDVEHELTLLVRTDASPEVFTIRARFIFDGNAISTLRIYGPSRTTGPRDR
jgi:hypothetical protein